VAVPAAACVSAGAWTQPAGFERRSHDAVLAEASAADVVLLGERHDALEDHRWQLDVLAGLLARRERLVVAFDAFARDTQPVLDRWTAGTLSLDELLGETRFAQTWGLPVQTIAPLLHFTRRHRLPALAMNVSRGLVAKVSRRGWAGVPAAEREGVGDPAKPGIAYVEELSVVYAEHGCRDPATVVGTPGFARFVDAQLLWDRAMAEVLVTASARHPGALVVGLVGTGHLEDGHGIPHQLAALGVADVSVLLPWDVGRGCAGLRQGVADFVFGVDPLPGERPAPKRHACAPPDPPR
jgi:uncharacterized iron-regulated protein